MAIWAIGDLQGCLDPLRRLLDAIDYQPVRDRLWFAGDLVNRGPQSLETLRFVRDLDPVTVLGNHDLHLLALRLGVRALRPRDTLAPIVRAHDCDELLHWLRHRPLLHHDPEHRSVLVHAGIYPRWSLERALALAGEVETRLRGETWERLIAGMYGDEPARWRDDLIALPRLRFIINAFTRMRYCNAAGDLELGANGAPGSQPSGFVPWFELPARREPGLRVAFGHWSALPFFDSPELLPLDSGCVWGNSLSAVRLDPAPVVWQRVPCA